MEREAEFMKSLETQQQQQQDNSPSDVPRLDLSNIEGK